MGLQIGEIVPRREIEFSDLRGKVIAVDAFNAIYQFLSSIRQPDGTPLKDSLGNVTSHLSGLFYRNIALLSEGIKLIYVFDGKADALKGKTHEQRQFAKDKAREEYEKARDEEDVEKMGKYARALSELKPEMIEESKELLKAMGIAIVQAPSEGEMQCAELVKEGKAWAVASQDYDAIVVGADRLIQNLTLARTRRTVSGVVKINPEIIEYAHVLRDLEVGPDRLICLAILVGTDFNPKGISGIGPKKALSCVHSHKYPVDIFRQFEGRIDFDWKQIFEIFHNPNVDKNADVEFGKFDRDKIKEILVNRHDFSLDRVEKQFGKLEEGKKKGEQQRLF